MSNELYNTIARVTDGIYEGTKSKYPSVISFMLSTLIVMLIVNYTGIAIGGDVFPGSTLSDHVLRFNNIPQVYNPLYYYCSYG